MLFVFYFGEHVDIYHEDGTITHDGAWRAGQPDGDGLAKPGIIMPGRFLLGSRYFQEQARCPYCQETNPLIRPFVERGRLPTYLFAAAIKAGIMYIADRMLDRADPMWRYFPIAVTIVHAIAGTWNIYQSMNDVGPP